jgi:hypothetical protein
MATKLSRKTLPSGIAPADFKYVGRPAKEQGDFEDDVGIVDMACVNQFGEANNSKYYHAGVVQASGQWFVYLEWGRISGGKSWNGSFSGGDYQFVQCSSEGDARAFFKKQCLSKNLKRLEKKKIGSKEIWAGKKGKDGYLVQSLATRERGLPDAYGIKDDTGVAKKKATKKVTKKRAKKIDAQPQVIKLAQDLVGGTADYARAAQQASGIVPTMSAINEVRDELIPEALTLLKKIGPDESKQLKNKKLQDLSKLVATIVPRPIPRGGDPSAILLSQNNIFSIQQDLDAFEAALKNEDFSEVEIKGSQVDPNQVLGRKITWIDPNSTRGRWIANTYQSMSNNRHGHLRNQVQVLNIFEVEKPDFRLLGHPRNPCGQRPADPCLEPAYAQGAQGRSHHGLRVRARHLLRYRLAQEPRVHRSRLLRRRRHHQASWVLHVPVRPCSGQALHGEDDHVGHRGLPAWSRLGVCQAWSHFRPER